MQNYYIKIGGIYCDNCRKIIQSRLIKNKKVKKCSISGNIAAVQGAENIEQELISAINGLGYVTKEEWISQKNRWKVQQIIGFFLVIFAFLAVRGLINRLLGYDILNVIPTIDSSITLGAVFITGVLTSLHCVGMCGAINLVASTSRKNAVIYNAGRVLCYTAVGAVVGGIGSVLSFNRTVLNVFTVIAAAFMLVLGVGMTGLVSVPNVGFKAETAQKKSSNAFVIGFLNGFMPCAPLAAMQLYAMSTASPVIGGVSMLLFGLGTVPLMLGFGLIRNLFEKKKELIQRIMAAFVILLSVSMMLRGLSALNVNVNTSGTELSRYIVADVGESEQTVTVNLTYSSYGDIAVKKDVPVTFVIHAEENYITGCNGVVMSSDFGFKTQLKAGDNVITFTPTEAGTYTYTCWMNMIRNTIYVYE